MIRNNRCKITFRIFHRYLGYFLAGIMTMYAFSGIVLTYRDTNIFKIEKHHIKDIGPGISEGELGAKLNMRRLKLEKTEGEILYFNLGTYNAETGVADYTTQELPAVLKKLTSLHMKRSEEKYSWLNIFFGFSLFFFVVSSFFMFPVKAKNFKKGIVVAVIGIAFAVLVILLK